jgi:hypothetical protein
MPGISYKVETIGRIDTPAGEFTVAPLVKSSGDLVLERHFVSNIGTVKRVSYNEEGFAIETRELLEYSFPERDGR